MGDREQGPVPRQSPIRETRRIAATDLKRPSVDDGNGGHDFSRVRVGLLGIVRARFGGFLVVGGSWRQVLDAAWRAAVDLFNSRPVIPGSPGGACGDGGRRNGPNGARLISHTAAKHGASACSPFSRRFSPIGSSALCRRRATIFSRILGFGAEELHSAPMTRCWAAARDARFRPACPKSGRERTHEGDARAKTGRRSWRGTLPVVRSAGARAQRN